MKVLGICGSPREKSNSEYLVQYALNQLNKQGLGTELIRLREKEIAQCRGCYSCIKAKKCVVEDDFQEVFHKMLGVEGLLLGSPVYHASITPRLKALMDRAGFSGRWATNPMKEKSESYAWKGTVFSGKVAAPVTVARRAGKTFAFAQLLLWLTVNDFIVVGSTYWNVGVAGKGGSVDAEQDEEGLNILNHLAQNMAYVIKKLYTKEG